MLCSSARSRWHALQQCSVSDPSKTLGSAAPQAALASEAASFFGLRDLGCPRRRVTFSAFDGNLFLFLDTFQYDNNKTLRRSKASWLSSRVMPTNCLPRAACTISKKVSLSGLL